MSTKVMHLNAGALLYIYYLVMNVMTGAGSAEEVLSRSLIVKHGIQNKPSLLFTTGRYMGRESPDPRDWTFSVGPRKGLKMILEDQETGCWIWQGNTWGGYGVTVYNRKTYPNISIGRKHRNSGGSWSAIMPHQLFYFLRYGNPPKGTELGHTCSRRSCCNPDHVRPITQLQNIAEMYTMPKLSTIDRAWIEEQLLDDKPTTWIANELNISVWSVRKIASEVSQREQIPLFDPEVPF